MRASGVRRGNVIDTTVLTRETDSGLAALSFRVELRGKPGSWHSIKAASRVELKLRVAPGSRAVLRVRARDVAGNETTSGFTLPR